ncbi:hypothetical protein VFPPC_15515 [Pochonia chlamydosporia 170]|uniref:Uncharacterized protein n=1 Tax=Pochonia chlamydosporia 170 TaxID=1380566 RepID=A0A179FWI6_METCM|nr:hypothetical protein VFPPC_15515 [Pochonia chlamydosporia 170]OAQ69984.1 hypothetical protein VFPPC_15515 [Pochonia chlamydosporia 170]
MLPRVNRPGNIWPDGVLMVCPSGAILVDNLDSTSIRLHVNRPDHVQHRLRYAMVKA